MTVARRNPDTRGDLTAAPVVVVILTYNQAETTVACLRSLFASGDDGFRVVVWDNGSTDETGEQVSSLFPDVLFHQSPVNLGVASGRNGAAALAMEQFGPTYLLFLDNDMEVEPGFVSALARPFAEDPGVGQTQAKLRFMDDRERLNDGGGCRIQFWLGKTEPVGFGEMDEGQYDQRTPCVSCGGAMMVRADLFRELEGFDSRFDPFGPEDLDFSLRLQNRGYAAYYVPDAVAYHAVSHTFGGDYSGVYARNKVKHWVTFLRRHGPWHQQLAFFLLAAPFVLGRAVLRELGRGNVSGAWGLVSGSAASLLGRGDRRS
jgi:GT2 family glycosyltransferase